MTDTAREDAIIKEAEQIKARAFNDAQERWKATPDAKKNRPWPRCHNIQCNRTLICLELNGGRCQGFDF